MTSYSFNVPTIDSECDAATHAFAAKLSQEIEKHRAERAKLEADREAFRIAVWLRPARSWNRPGGSATGRRRTTPASSRCGCTPPGGSRTGSRNWTPTPGDR